MEIQEFGKKNIFGDYVAGFSCKIFHELNVFEKSVIKTQDILKE